MFAAHTSVMPFKDYRLRSQVPTCDLTFSRTSNQFPSRCRLGPNYFPRMWMGPSLQQKSSGRETPPLQAPNHKPSLLSKFILVPAICSYLTIAFFTAFMSERRDPKTVISLAYVETFTRWSPTKGTLRRAGFATSSSKSLRNRNFKSLRLR